MMTVTVINNNNDSSSSWQQGRGRNWVQNPKSMKTYEVGKQKYSVMMIDLISWSTVASEGNLPVVTQVS